MSSTKQDTEITGNQDTNTGSGSRKPNDVGELEQHYNNKKKATPTQQNKDSRVNRSVSNSNGGGRNSNHSYKKPDKYKKETSEHGNHGNNNRQGTKINNKDGGQHGWTGGHSRMSKFTGGEVPRRSHKIHSGKTSKIQENTDSGIGEGSSPEGATLLQKESNNEDGVNNNITGDTTDTTVLKNDTEPRHIYDRDFLLSIRTCTKSLITPAGLDRLQLDVAKDLLKGNHRQYGGEEDGSSDTGDNESTTNHSSTLPFNKDCVDVKSKVSLMPQRRSFGSGCSWREHPINKPTTLPSTSSTSSSNNTVGIDDNQSINKTIDDNNNEPTINWSCGTPRIIDHIPYRSRQANEWKETKGHNWRKDRNTDECYEEDDEPEWMSFGPSDRYELMELKGIDDHESERKARNDSLRKNDDKPSSPEESPSSSPSDKDVPLIDSGLPSSCPNDDDDEYILDGFDFKSVLSICQELASDNEYEEPLSTVTDSIELENALITVLGISNTDGSVNTENNQSHVRAMTLDEIEGQTDVTTDGIDQTAFNKFLASIKHHDQGSDVANSREATTLIKPPSHTVFPDSREATTLIKPPSHTVFTDSREATTLIKPPSHTVFPDNLMYNDYQYYDTPPYNNTPTLYAQTRHNENHTHQSGHHAHQSGWPTTSSALWNGDDNRPSPSSNRYSSLNPSPSSLGMHPHHMRQQKQSSTIPSNNNWVTEMEQMRQSELNQLRYYNKQRQEQIMYQSTTTQQKQQTAAPSLGFLPTSVMKHIHNSKPSQSIQDIARTPYSRMDHGYTPEGSVNYPPYSTDSNQYHHQSQYRHYPPPIPTNPNPQYQYINTSNAAYRPNLRGGPTMEQGGMYHSQRSQYTRQGSSPVKPPGLY